MPCSSTKRDVLSVPINKVLIGEETNKGFGLFNVQQRIRLFSESEDYGITAETEEGKYAAFTILIKQPSDRKNYK